MTESVRYSGEGLRSGVDAAFPLLGELTEARLFVVDDNPANVALLVAVLNEADFVNVFTEMDPRKVLARLAEVDPDLIILDLHMPHIDGFEVLRQVRLLVPPEALPVLVLTADTTAASSARALQQGAQDFINKPFNNDEVVVRTQNLLRSRFVYTTLRSSIVREREAVLHGHQMTVALDSEQRVVARLQQLDAVKDTLLQTVSHDLRSPLWAAQLLTEALADDARSARPMTVELRSAIIAKVYHNTTQIERLLTDILDSDPMRVLETLVRSCDVGETVSRVLAETDLGEKHSLHTNISHVIARVDPAHLERIISNLLGNARDHVPAGVPIWVTVTEADNEVLIAVDDAGSGVPPDVADTIFEPFRRGANSAPGGLGLGLSLVSRFAQMHGGRAWVADRPGGGASFRVSLPAALGSDVTETEPRD